jgi:hypothetical protein
MFSNLDRGLTDTTYFLRIVTRLVIRHRVWIGKWIYWSLLQLTITIQGSTQSTIHYSTHKVSHVFTGNLSGNASHRGRFLNFRVPRLLPSMACGSLTTKSSLRESLAIVCLAAVVYQPLASTDCLQTHSQSWLLTDCSQSQSQSYFTTGGLPQITSSWRLAPWGSRSEFFFATKPLWSQSLGNISDERMGLSYEKASYLSSVRIAHIA